MKIITKKYLIVTIISVIIFFMLSVGLALSNSNNSNNNNINNSKYEEKNVPIDQMEKEVEIPIPKEAAKEMKREAREMKEKGYAEMPENYIPPKANEIKKHKTILSLERLAKNTTFQIEQPKWLPNETKLIGGIGNEPDRQGPWVGVTLIYKSPLGEIQISQAQPQSGGRIAPTEFITEKIKGHPAIAMRWKGNKTGQRWNNISWNVGNIEFDVGGEIPLNMLKKIADSL